MPDRGDAIWLQFEDTEGHEQRGRRPALVVSPRKYNERFGIAVCCPITSKAKGYPFEVMIPGPGKVSGVILTDQIRSLDVVARQAEFITRIDASTLEQVQEKLRTLLFA